MIMGVETTSFAVSPTGASWMRPQPTRKDTWRSWTHENEWSIQRFLDSDGFASSVAFAPDGERLAVGDDAASLCPLEPLIRPRHCAEVRTALAGRKFLAYSPDGRSLAEASNSSCEIAVPGPHSANIANHLPPRAHLGECRVCSIDGRYVAAGEVEIRPAVFLWKLTTRRSRTCSQDYLEASRRSRFHPMGRLIAMCSGYERGVRLWDFRRGRLLRTTAGHAFGSIAVAFSPNRTTLASVGGDGKARLWIVNSGELLAVLNGRTMGLAHVAFSADGQTLIAAGPFDNDLRIWQLTLPSAG